MHLYFRKSSNGPVQTDGPDWDFTIPHNFAAFNYDKQEWITGADALALHIRQTRESLALAMNNPEYCRMIGVNQAAHVRRLRDELARYGCYAAATGRETVQA